MEAKVVSSSGNVETYSDGTQVAYFDENLEAASKDSAVIAKVMRGDEVTWVGSTEKLKGE